MQSFRTELENPIVEKDIIDLEKKIRLFREGNIAEEKFRSLRLARGVYGQRQQGVQMIRIKLPFGKMTVKQLLRISDVSDEFSTGKLHLTTRQDIQIHYVSLEKTPELWAKLELDSITLREACGNTVRNVTASPTAGIDPKEPFDVTPYAHAAYLYFLRNPICQELGRKFKIAFSSSDEDTALTYMHDAGFIPKVRNENGTIVRGFKVLIGGGLGAQPYMAHVAYEFLEEDQIMPFTEAVLRVFDRHGERTNRNKARIKYLIQKIGFPAFMKLVDEERIALKSKTETVDRDAAHTVYDAAIKTYTTFKAKDGKKYEDWLKTNTFEQKQHGYFGVYIRVLLGDLSTATARKFAEVVKNYAADDIRITINQGFMIRYVPKEALLALYKELDSLGFAEPGFDSVGDITACPGTDTCNLGISSSTGVTVELEKVIKEEYPDLIYNKDIKIKISGCMNSCGQHSMAQIGFHGSSFKVGANVIPAMQLVLGGGTVGDGVGRVSEKILKIPTKRTPALLRTILNDYETHSIDNEYFNTYYDRVGKDYFYQLLKEHADVSVVKPEEMIDWGHSEKFNTAIGVGECAGVMIDLVATLLFEADEKEVWAQESLSAGAYSDALYHSYSVFIQTAKSLLLGKQISCNTQVGIINDFDKHFVATGEFKLNKSFNELVMQINKQEASKEFAEEYFTEAKAFLKKAKRVRDEELSKEGVLEE